jgi:hypothetical protein
MYVTTLFSMIEERSAVHRLINPCLQGNETTPARIVTEAVFTVGRAELRIPARHFR